MYLLGGRLGGRLGSRSGLLDLNLLYHSLGLDGFAVLRSI